MAKITVRRLLTTVLGAASTVLLVTTVAALPGSAATNGTLFVVQGLPRASVDVSIDGRSVAQDVQGATLAGPFEVAAGAHVVTFAWDGAAPVERSVTMAAGDSRDLVLHLPVQSGADPVVTVFDNDLSGVPADKGGLTVAHTAAVPPADIVVNGEVLFANVANGESLNIVVPVSTYEVKIVPTGQTTPVVLGPLNLTITGGSLNRVFAVGDPASDDMRVVVQVIDVADAGSPLPARVETGSGGQSVGAVAGPDVSGLFWSP